MILVYFSTGRKCYDISVVAKYRFFVAFHKNLFKANYSLDRNFNINKFTFIETGSSLDCDIDQYFVNHTIKESHLYFYNPLMHKLDFFAPATWYHIYKNKLHENYEYIGLLEYDLILNSNFTENIQQINLNNRSGVWSFSFKHKLNEVLSQTYIKIEGIDCIEQALNDYNKFFQTNYTSSYLKSNFDYFPTQQSFFADKFTFEKIMSFISHTIENKSLIGFKSYKLPATVLERYFGVAILLTDFQGALNLDHLNSMGWKEKRFLSYKIKHNWEDLKLKFLNI